MLPEPATYPDFVLDRLNALESRCEQLTAENEEQKNLVAFLADEMGSDVVQRLERERHSRLVERLVVDAFQLHSASDLYWLPEANGRLAGSRKGDKISKLNSRRYVHRAAQVTLYYLLTQHCANVSMRWLETWYGYTRNSLARSMGKMVMSKDYRVMLARIERDYLDGIGRIDEPTTEFVEHSIRDASALKQFCEKRGIDYRRSLNLID